MNRITIAYRFPAHSYERQGKTLMQIQQQPKKESTADNWLYHAPLSARRYWLRFVKKLSIDIFGMQGLPNKKHEVTSTNCVYHAITTHAQPPVLAAV